MAVGGEHFAVTAFSISVGFVREGAAVYGSVEYGHVPGDVVNWCVLEMFVVIENATFVHQVPPRLSTTVQQDIMADCGMTPGTLCYDKRLFVTNTTKAERAKHAQFTNSSVRHREQVSGL